MVAGCWQRRETVVTAIAECVAAKNVHGVMCRKCQNQDAVPLNLASPRITKIAQTQYITQKLS